MIRNKIIPTHRCKICGALWTYSPQRDTGLPCGDTWHLFSDDCGECCDNAVMGDQIEMLTVREFIENLKEIL
jgi:hypothetical protein